MWKKGNIKVKKLFLSFFPWYLLAVGLSLNQEVMQWNGRLLNVSYPSLWQQEVEMWLCRLPVLMDAFTSVSQHCGKREREGDFGVIVGFSILQWHWFTHGKKFLIASHKSIALAIFLPSFTQICLAANWIKCTKNPLICDSCCGQQL